MATCMRILGRLAVMLLLLPLSSPFFSTLSAQTTWDGIDHKGEAWVRNMSRPWTPSQGLEGRHLALWASHGRYFDQQKDSAWKWQRPSLFCTNEDLFTQTIVVPFLIPMLENAGAVVFTPRERDWQRNEVIVDNDQLHSLVSYREHNFRHIWTEAIQPGFAVHPGNYHDGENPFKAGTARMIETTKSKSKYSHASYQPDLPEAGRYAVYVSYQSMPQSVDDAHYIVYHQGQKTEFRVNQQMGGSTWVYLGSFLFDKGSSEYNRVVVTNQSRRDGVVTTDAVRFGGGMGNIERGGHTSGLPRCLEGSRYYAQWAGMPYEVYSTKMGTNDYADDINARSLTVNELMGGSAFAPDSIGRKVPIELSLAIHSDAGYNTDGQGIYGSLTICTTQKGDATLASGRPRQMSKELATELLDNTTNDLAALYGTWTARHIYDRNYSETRLPLMPSAILETMSHQNFGDMRYGQDPNFRFALARSIYKTLLRYITSRHDKPAVVQPLTPNHFRIDMNSHNGEAQLSWMPVSDDREPTANATGYIVYTAEGSCDFDNGQYVRNNHLDVKLRPGTLYSFRVAAVNKGGASFPTQVLSAYYHGEDAKTICIVDGFHRLSSPAILGQGFDMDEDPGVGYGRTAGWLGRQLVFDESRIGIEDSTGLGYSGEELAGRFIAGNDFCYARTHAQAIVDADIRYNIVSCASESFKARDYSVVDLLLGLERNDGHSLVSYKSFPGQLQEQLRTYTANGGSLLVSGAYIASDMTSPEEQAFVNDVLKCQYGGQSREQTGIVNGLGMKFSFYRQLNETHYAATTTDVLTPKGTAFCAMAYNDGTSAAVAYKGNDYSLFVMGFPLECIVSPKERTLLMKGIIHYLNN